MRKKVILSVLPAFGLALCLLGMPVKARTSDLDVKAGDIYSLYTYKDSGSLWENRYYVTPTTYIGGGIMGNSVSQQTGIASGATLMSTYADSYLYVGCEAPGGIYYRLVTGPTYYATPDWHLIGRYTP